MASIKLSISGVPSIASTSAVADYLDADKHLNLGKATTAGKKIEAAAERFRKAHAKGDAVAARVLGKIEGVRTPRQIEKAQQPVGYYVVRKSAKTENFSVVKNKNQDATYLRKRAFRVSQRKTLSDMYTVLFPVYHAQILDKEAKALQRDLIAAVATHMKGMEGTKAKATKITADNNAAEVADYQGSMKVLKSVLTGADKLKEAALFELTPARGKPALYLNVPGAGFLVVRHCTRAAFLKAKKVAATPAAKSESASAFSKLLDNSELTGLAGFATKAEGIALGKRAARAAMAALNADIEIAENGGKAAITIQGTDKLKLDRAEFAAFTKIVNNIKANLDHVNAAPVADHDIRMLVALRALQLAGIYKVSA